MNVRFEWTMFLQIFNSLFLKPLHRHWRRVRVWRCLRKTWRWGERRTRPSGPSRARWGWPSSPTSTQTSQSLSPARHIHSTLMTAESPTMLVSPLVCTVQYWNIRHHAVQYSTVLWNMDIYTSPSCTSSVISPTMAVTPAVLFKMDIYVAILYIKS